MTVEPLSQTTLRSRASPVVIPVDAHDVVAGARVRQVAAHVEPDPREVMHFQALDRVAIGPDHQAVARALCTPVQGDLEIAADGRPAACQYRKQGVRPDGGRPNVEGDEVGAGRRVRPT